MDWFNILNATYYDKPYQELSEALKYRSKEEGLGEIFPVINRIIPKHEEYAYKDKANSTKHKRWAKLLRTYQSQVKQMIIDSESDIHGN